MTKQRREKLHGQRCNFSAARRRPWLHERNSCHGRNRQRRPPTGQPNSQQQASRCARSPVSRTPRSFPHGVEAGRHRPQRDCRGASAVFLNSRALGDELAPVVDHARREGVTRLVALSAINADDDFSRQPSRFRGDRNKEVEQHAVDSGLEWVSLRPTVFATNFFGMWAPQIQAGDVVSGPYAAASTAPIVDPDISAVAAHALLTDELVGRKVPLDRPAGAHQHGARGRHRHRSRSPAALPGGAPRARAPALHRPGLLPPSSPTRTWRCWRRRCPSPHWSPTRWRRSSAGPPTSFADAVAAHRDLFTN